MAAYMVFEIEVTDPVAYGQYLREAGPMLAAAGGTFVFSGSDVVPLEGGWSPPSISVVRFETDEAALNYFRSAAYQVMATKRRKASNGRGVLVRV